MNDKLAKLLTRAGAEVCKFLAGWLTTADFTHGAMVYAGLTVLQIFVSTFLGQMAVPGTAAKKQSMARRFVGRL